VSLLLKALGICGSPRRGGNTDLLLDVALRRLKELGVVTEKLALRDFDIRPCTSCRYCVDAGCCCIDDDMTGIVIPKLLAADIIVVASPVYFNNVSAYVKTFMDRTWCIRGRLKDKVGGGIVVGRGYGLESALTAIHAFMLKHEMVLGHRGVSGIAYELGEVLKDSRAVRDAEKLAVRLYELTRALKLSSGKT